MQMGFGLWQEQTQRLVMTPELRQAITVLQFSAQELLEYLETEATQNPVMELDAPDWSRIAREQRDKQLRTKVSTHKQFPLDSVIRSSQTLEEHLCGQLNLMKALPDEQKLAAFIIGSLDNNGYLKLSLEEIAELRNSTVEQVQKALQLVQSLEPTGVGAQSLEECLLLQLREVPDAQETAAKIISGHLPAVAQGKISKIALALGITNRQVQDAIDLIRTLDPKPGRWYSGDLPAYIVPDVTVEKVSGEYLVLVNDRAVPRLQINDFYRQLLEQRSDSVTGEARDFITAKLNSALWLLKSMEQRRQTLYNVTSVIVELQREFFENGVSKLRPLTLKIAAEKAGVHESTISRAVSGKFVQTPRGIFELKYFFDSGVATLVGDGASAESIKAKIKSIIETEEVSAPCSDQQLSEMLQAQGIQISRRTVAKYREELGIASSMQRKRY